MDSESTPWNFQKIPIIWENREDLLCYAPDRFALEGIPPGGMSVSSRSTMTGRIVPVNKIYEVIYV